MDVYLSPGVTCLMSALAPCLCSTYSPRVWGKGQHRAGKSMDLFWAPLSGQGWGGLAPLVDEEQLPCNGRSPKRQ